ncbi:MAG: DUF308 domain-containing protein, partial [Lachnospiraceae bacterium]|nr:DUF308 domain-containing protein [Lachnospiraceae bacterium]
MKSILQKIKWNSLITALLCLAIGVVLLVWPDISSKVFCMALAVVLVLIGLFYTLAGLFSGESNLYYRGSLVAGILLLVIGLWILKDPEKILELVPVLVGVVILIHGIINLKDAVRLMGMHYGKWWIALVFALLTVIFAVLLIFNPFGTLQMLVRVLGVALIYDGLSDLWIISRLSVAA